MEKFIVAVNLNTVQLKSMLEELKGIVEFDLRIKTGTHHLGKVLASLPPKVHPQIDRVMERDAPSRPKQWRPGSDGPYRPAPGTAPHAIVELIIHRGPQRLRDMTNGLQGKFVKSAISTALYKMRDRAWIKQLPDGRWGLGPQAQPAKPKPKLKPAIKPKSKPKEQAPPAAVAAPVSNGKGAEV